MASPSSIYTTIIERILKESNKSIKIKSTNTNVSNKCTKTY